MTINPITPPDIISLSPGEVFVFGSNLAGRHGKGAALTALRFGAIRGVPMGPAGNTYAIATKDQSLQTLPLWIIEQQVRVFRAYATLNPGTRFLVTAIGCGLAGLKPQDVAPMFRDCPRNISLPLEFVNVLDEDAS
jgi:hypothetical protein